MVQITRMFLKSCTLTTKFKTWTGMNDIFLLFWGLGHEWSKPTSTSTWKLSYGKSSCNTHCFQRKFKSKEEKEIRRNKMIAELWKRQIEKVVVHFWIWGRKLGNHVSASIASPDLNPTKVARQQKHGRKNGILTGWRLILNNYNSFP